jgi:hypothetical protein
MPRGKIDRSAERPGKSAENRLVFSGEKLPGRQPGNFGPDREEFADEG